MSFMHNEYSLPSATGTADIYIQSLSPENTNDIIGVIQIIHGMAEHSDRYLDVAEYLCTRGFAVVLYDHAGHGKSIKTNDDLGFFCKENGFIKIVEDANQVTKLAKEKFPDKKLILWGHSMGSFVTRSYISKYAEDVDGAVICGTSGKNPAADIGIMLANAVAKIKGARYRSKFIDSMAFGTYNKKFDGNTGFEWLSKNEENIKKYVADEKCGYLFSASAFADLFSLLKEVSSDECFDKTPKNLPLYLIAGDMDPVGNYGKGVKEVYERYKATVHNVQIKLYPSLRHEIHNELEKEEIYKDIADFALSICK